MVWYSSCARCLSARRSPSCAAGQTIPCHQAAQLLFLRHVGAPYPVAPRVHAALIQKGRGKKYHAFPGTVDQAAALGQNEGVQAGVETGFLFRVGKNHFAKGAAVQRFTVEDPVSERLAQGRQPLSARRGQGAGHLVRIHDARARTEQRVRQVGLAAGNAARYTNDQHAHFVSYQLSPECTSVFSGT